MKRKLVIKALPPYDEVHGLLNCVLPELFDVEISNKRYDLVIGSTKTPIEYLNCEGVKLFYTGENIVPDFNLYDYAIGFDYLDFGDRYLRLPLYCLYPEFDALIEQPFQNSDEDRVNRKFCSMVVSNAHWSSPIRKEFFEELSKYKRVDSAGRYLNNMGGSYLEDKQAFISQYKFNIAFENSSVPGYTTEKIMHAMAANTLPIYWGNPLVGRDFNPKSFVNLLDFKSLKECVDYIVFLDQHDEKYLEMLHVDRFNLQGNYKDYKERIRCFFNHILTQEDASRLSPYGRQAIYRKEQMDKAVYYSKIHAVGSTFFVKRCNALKSMVYKWLHHS
jgi:hypothetical protein